MSGGEARLLGRFGEMAVAEDLRRRGFQILAAGYHCRFGEIDLVTADDKYLIFTEVKLRKNAHFAPGRAFVDTRKQKKLRITAECYLAQHPTELQPRFDVAEVYAPQGTATVAPSITYIVNAF